MANFLAELKRRHIFRVAAAYAVLAWVLFQLIDSLASALKLPDWAVMLVLVLLFLGFPVALLFAWRQQLVPADGTTARAATGKLDWALMAALVVVIVLASYESLTPGVGTAQQASVTPTSTQSQPGGISVAVLPLANVSGDAGQEFFSDGMTDEIMRALAKVSALHVVGRESAFQFKDRKTETREVGQALGAAYLIEGSVHKSGDRVRITTQLIQADNGVSLWTNSYDHELKDIFATQSDIAEAVAGVLGVPLGLKPGETLVKSRMKDESTYEDYLRAKTLVRSRGEDRLVEAKDLLERVVLREPDFAPAWALLGIDYGLIPTYHPAMASGAAEQLRPVVDISLPKAEAAANLAIALDSNSPDGYIALGYVQFLRGNYVLAGDSYSKALGLDAANPNALNQYSYMLACLGYMSQAIAMRQRLQAVEPFVPIFAAISAVILSLSGQIDDAITLAKPLAMGGIPLGELYAAKGNYSEAVEAIRSIPAGVFLPGTTEAAAGLLSAGPKAAASLRAPPRLGILSWVYAYVGAPDRFWDLFDDAVGIAHIHYLGTVIWSRSFADLRKSKRFGAYVRDYGILDFWHAKGFPDLCRPLGIGDFVCD